MGPPRKFLGHGICDARSKLFNLRSATSDPQTLKNTALQLLKEARVPPDRLRGMGLTMTRLEPVGGGTAGASNALSGAAAHDESSAVGSDSAGGDLHSWLRRAAVDQQAGKVGAVAGKPPWSSEGVLDSRPKGNPVRGSVPGDGSARSTQGMTPVLPGEAAKAMSDDESRIVPTGRRERKRPRDSETGSETAVAGPPTSRPRTDSAAGAPLDDEATGARLAGHVEENTKDGRGRPAPSTMKNAPVGIAPRGVIHGEENLQ